MHVRAGKAEGHARSGYRVQSPSPRRGQQWGALARLEDGRWGQRGAIGAGARPPVCPCQAWLASPGREQTRGIRTWPVSSGLAPRHRGDGTTGHLRAQGGPASREAVGRSPDLSTSAPPARPRAWAQAASRVLAPPPQRTPSAPGAVARPAPAQGACGHPDVEPPHLRRCRWGRAQPQSRLCAERLAPPPSASPRVRASQDSRSLTSGPPPPHPTETRCRCGQGHLETSPP